MSYWLLATGYWLLATGYWLLAGCGNGHSVTIDFTTLYINALTKIFGMYLFEKSDIHLKNILAEEYFYV